MAILNEAPEMHLQMVSSHGMLAILEVLEGKCSRDVTLKLLQILNLVGLQLSLTVRSCSDIFLQLVTEDLGFLESFCLIGGIPVMMGMWYLFRSTFLGLKPLSKGFTSKKYSTECRSEASHFIRLLCHTSALTLQMFISYVIETDSQTIL